MLLVETRSCRPRSWVASASYPGWLLSRSLASTADHPGSSLIRWITYSSASRPRPPRVIVLTSPSSQWRIRQTFAIVKENSSRELRTYTSQAAGGHRGEAAVRALEDHRHGVGRSALVLG